jgi:hypothetical protein
MEDKHQSQVITIQPISSLSQILKESNESKLNKTLLSISLNSDLNVVNKSVLIINCFSLHKT